MIMLMCSGLSSFLFMIDVGCGEDMLYVLQIPIIMDTLLFILKYFVCGYMKV